MLLRTILHCFYIWSISLLSILTYYNFILKCVANSGFPPPSKKFCSAFFFFSLADGHTPRVFIFYIAARYFLLFKFSQ